MSYKTYQPDSAEVLNFLEGKTVVAGTGHRPNKLGGYGLDLEGLAADGGIRYFAKEFGWLGNFSRATVWLDGAKYPTLEHAFQAAKTSDQKVRAKIRKTKDASEAKKIGQSVELPEKWDEQRVEVMKKLLKSKFSDRFLREKLISTGTLPLVHNNRHGDTFWGVVKGEGTNMLGKLLMELREEIRKDMSEEAIRCFTDPLESLYKVALTQLRELKPDVVVSGGALGWDTALALAAIKLNIPLVMAIPFRGQEGRWNKESQERYRKICQRAQFVVAVCSEDMAKADAVSAMQWRNEWMVDHSTLLLACFDGTPGGTANCVRDAEEQGRKMKNAYPMWAEMAGYKSAKGNEEKVVRVLDPKYGEGTIPADWQTVHRYRAPLTLPSGQRVIAYVPWLKFL